MNCDKFAEKLGDFLDDELNPDERQALQEHMTGCPACKEMFESHQAVANRLLQNGPMSPSPQLKSKVMETILKGANTPTPSSTGPSIGAKLILAGLIAAVPIGLGVLSHFGKKPLAPASDKPEMSLSQPPASASFLPKTDVKPRVASQTAASQAVQVDKTPE